MDPTAFVRNQIEAVESTEALRELAPTVNAVLESLSQDEQQREDWQALKDAFYTRRRALRGEG